MESIDSEKSAYARATYRTEYATATAAVIFSSCATGAGPGGRTTRGASRGSRRAVSGCACTGGRIWDTRRPPRS